MGEEERERLVVVVEEAVACKAFIVSKSLNGPPCYLPMTACLGSFWIQLSPMKSLEVAIQGHLQMYHWVHGTDQASFWQKTGCS